MIKIYLDTCIWGRPFDSRSEKTINETEAFFKILRKADNKGAVIVGSAVLDEEIEEIKSVHKRDFIKSLMFYSMAEKLDYVPDAYMEMVREGLKIPDASHIAYALELNAIYFITVDKRLLGKKKKIEEKYEIKVCGPEEFLEMEGE